jgi:hypothetical protein
MPHNDRRSLSLLGFAAVALAPLARSPSIDLAGRESSWLPFQSLTRQQQHWIATAFASLNRIWQNRVAGAPGNNAWCIFEAGDIYVQFLAPWNAKLLVGEAVSATSVPELAGILDTQAKGTLLRLGFTPPAVSPNYSRTIIVESIEDLADAARLAFNVLREVYRVADFARTTFKVKLPTSGGPGAASSRRTALAAVT